LRVTATCTPLLLAPPADDKRAAAAQRAFDDLIDAAITLRDTVIGKHGIGLLKMSGGRLVDIRPPCKTEVSLAPDSGGCVSRPPGVLMIRTVSTRLGRLAALTQERNGRWSATLVGGHPSLGVIDSAIGDTADGALLNLSASVDAAVGAALGMVRGVTECHAGTPTRPRGPF
jgi:hypothetical protein